jgi:hypothetical protein
MQASRKISEVIVVNRAGITIKNQHARAGAISERRLRNEFRRKIKVEVGDEHGLTVRSGAGGRLISRFRDF